MSNSLVPDQAQQNLGPNCLQTLSADDTRRVKPVLYNPLKIFKGNKFMQTTDLHIYILLSK